MLLNKQAVKQYIHEQGYQVSKEGMMAIDRKITNIIDLAIKKLNGRKTITEMEILSQ